MSKTRDDAEVEQAKGAMKEALGALVGNKTMKVQGAAEKQRAEAKVDDAEDKGASRDGPGTSKPR